MTRRSWTHPCTRRTLLLAIGLTLLLVGTGAPLAAAPPWPPADPTVPYLPPVDPVVCGDGDRACFTELERTLGDRSEALDCDHDAVFNHAYLIITRALLGATDAGVFDRPTRVTHEAASFADAYLTQYAAWHGGDRASVAPAWRIALRAAEDGTQTAMGDLLLAIQAHIRRDQPTRGLEQTDGVLRVQGTMPAASGRPDHLAVDDVLQAEMSPLLRELAQRYDDRLDDGATLFDVVIDADRLYTMIAVWREEAWRDAEQLRHARAAGGVAGPLYQAKLAQIEEKARIGALLIRAGTVAPPGWNEQRDAYCEQQDHARS